MNNIYLSMAAFALAASITPGPVNIVALSAGKFLGWSRLDPVMGIVGSGVVSVWAYGLVRDTAGILLDRPNAKRWARGVAAIGIAHGASSAIKATIRRAKLGERFDDSPLEVKVRYQACDDKICYNPVSLPLSWKIALSANVPAAPRSAQP